MGFILAALIMGVAGSLHCAGMCGPLIMAMPYDRSSQLRFVKTKTINHLGRITTYAILGAIMGAIGQTASVFGWQRVISISAGIFILGFLLWPKSWKKPINGKFFSAGVVKLRTAFSSLLQKRNPGTLYLLGLINGLLPCGLVYVALAGSVATGDALKGSVFMVVFGLGTTPALVVVGAFTSFIRQRMGIGLQRAARVLLVSTALLLILRGSNLGIPYISPKAHVDNCGYDCCSH